MKSACLPNRLPLFPTMEVKGGPMGPNLQRLPDYLGYRLQVGFHCYKNRSVFQPSQFEPHYNHNSGIGFSEEASVLLLVLERDSPCHRRGTSQDSPVT